jgi:hypothetical protein
MAQKERVQSKIISQIRFIWAQFALKAKKCFENRNKNHINMT